MKKAIVYIFILICSVFNTYGQKAMFQMAKHILPDEAIKNKNSFSHLIAGNDSEFLVSDRTRSGNVMTSYNCSSLKKTGAFTVNFPENGKKDPDWVKWLYGENKITGIYSFGDIKGNGNSIYGKIIDRKNKAVIKEVALISGSAKKETDKSTFVFKHSKDNSKLLIFREPANKIYKDEKVELVLYNEHLNKIYEGELSFPNKNKDIRIKDILVTNDGHICIIAFWDATPEEKKEIPELNEQHIFKIFGVPEYGSELTEIIVKEGGYVLSSCQGVISDDQVNSILITGFYINLNKDNPKKITSDSLNGIYYFKLKTDTWKIGLSKYNFISEKATARLFNSVDTSEYAQAMAWENAKKGYSYSKYQLNELFINKNGNIKIISQFEYKQIVCGSGGDENRDECNTYYSNVHIVEINLTSSGELTGMAIVPKAQVVKNFTGYNGHLVISDRDKTYYIYNDAEKNYDENNLARYNNNNFVYHFDGGKKSRLCCAISDRKSKVTKVPLVDSWKNNILFYPSENIQLSYGSVVTFGKSRKGKAILLLRFFVMDK